MARHSLGLEADKHAVRAAGRRASPRNRFRDRDARVRGQKLCEAGVKLHLEADNVLGPIYKAFGEMAGTAPVRL